ncbi:MAG TPA: Gfo/Idh/MocA family oxidoreductase [Xanthobacteraceae bacterium]
MDILVVGTGLMADIYTSILSQRADCRVRAVVGNTPDKTRAFAARHGLEPYPAADYERPYADFPALRATVITTPEWIREAPVRAAVAHGQNILLEKPFAVSLAEAATLRTLLERPDRLTAICHVLRYSARFTALKALIEQGGVGEIRHIYARRNSNSARAQRVLGRTDLAFWLTPHDVDIMRWITGSEVVEVFARSRAKLREADDYLIANLRFANGVDAVLEISWCNPPLSGTSREAVFEVRGTKGFLEVEDSDMNVRLFQDGERVSSPDTYEYVDIQGAKRGFFEPMLDRFVTGVLAGAVTSTAVADGCATVRICDMIRRSLDTGGVIHDG